MRKKLNPATMYDKHHKLIKHKAWKWHNLTGRDVKELESEGNLVFMKALESWDPDKAQFSTWLSLQLDSKLHHYVSKTDLALPEPDMEYTATQQDGSDPSKVVEFKDLLASLKPEARLVADIIIHGPAEIIALVDAGNIWPRKLRGLLRSQLRTQGWSFSTIRSAFDDITNQLAT